MRRSGAILQGRPSAPGGTEAIALVSRAGLHHTAAACISVPNTGRSRLPDGYTPRGMASTSAASDMLPEIRNDEDVFRMGATSSGLAMQRHAYYRTFVNQSKRPAPSRPISIPCPLIGMEERTSLLPVERQTQRSDARPSLTCNSSSLYPRSGCQFIPGPLGLKTRRRLP
ncbi:hypothetical protein OH76DRAFT_230780 [Lentinus brumalis]|uniref:Uncharacterized protein n=1 Tax=Lentinus brumalis TaxID=2498619 RepID=A0A371DHD2_9APHY|nr:hypothetical protein OH76DRAFT_230780 [Polyporus brumalis]